MNARESENYLPINIQYSNIYTCAIFLTIRLFNLSMIILLTLEINKIINQLIT
jgi:hypothetical protein